MAEPVAQDDNNRDFYVDANNNQLIAYHAAFIRANFPQFVPVRDISRQNLKLRDIEYRYNNSLVYVECKSDSNDSENLCIELFSNVPYSEEYRDIWDEGFGKRRKRISLVGWDEKLHARCVALCASIDRHYYALGMSSDLEDIHYLSYYMERDNTIYFMDIRKLQEFVRDSLTKYQFSLGNTGTGNGWWSLNLLIPKSDILHLIYR